ncbi:MAG: hypothetical protein Q4B88_02980 [Moraxella sp.]|nr:hypothetical protein [Moraxella sp.]
MMRGVILALALSLPFASFAHTKQTYVLDTYDNAQALASVAQAQLSDGGSVTAYQDKLIIYASPSDYARIQSLLTQIDTAPAPVTLSVAVGQRQHSHSQGGQLTVGIHQDVWVNGNYQSHSTRQSQNTVYQVRGTHGYPLSISQSTLIGLAQNHAGAYATSHGIWQIRLQSTHWATLSDGISATTRNLPNGQIAINLNQRHRTATLSEQALSTHLTATRGQWVQIGSIRQTNHSLSSYATTHHSELPVWLKVD